ncbi:MAG: PD-(D/E)XK nuclease family protein, partial [Treponema sp.]|nr:PD-(D/E)XK nuclease family protein [Treponema sp.]
MSKIVFEKDTVQGTIAEILHKHISNPLDTTRFVFATNVVASSWIDWTLDHEVSAIAMERFWAWDSFKSEFFNMSEEGKQSIPSLLRKIFVRSLLVRCFHEAKTGTPLFKALIPPSVASQSLEETVAFTDWVVSLLPSLRLWYTKYTAYKNKYPQAYTDDVDEDYLTLYHLYAAFLAGEDRKGPVFFDPAWISSSKVEAAVTALKDDYIIFYPEILEDWDEYRLYFEKSSHITIVSLPEESHMTETMKHPAATFYTNARSELRALALQIRRLCTCKEEDAIPWNHIAVSVPDIATWRPYIQREFLLYGIPAVFRVGAPLTAGIGRLFRQLQNCYEHTFDYDSLRSLLLDSSIPWLKPERNEQLVRIGYETKCLCNDFSVTDAGDMWEQSLAASNTDNTSELDLRYYKSLKEHISKLCTANSFEKIYRQWFLFKKEFIQPDGFSASSDMLISRCITQLSALKDLEQQFFTELGLHCYSPYSFFVREIENTVYQPQIQQDGVSVFDYRVCAAGAYPYQFILNATQTDCSVQSQRFSFLSMTKRRELGISETANASDAYIRLYGANTHSVISCSEKTFSGFAIPYSLLRVSSKPVSFEVPADDFVRGMEHFLHDPHANHLYCISNMQKKGYDFWKFTQNACCDEYDSVSAFYKAKVDKAVHAIPRWENDTYKHIGPVSVTQSDLNDFVKCPRYWLYHRVLRIEEETFDTVLLSSFDMGEVNHKILELFMKYCKQEHNGMLPCT